jgi:hypothetical protein
VAERFETPTIDDRTRAMPLITEKMPDAWDQLEELVTAILNECGMKAQRQISLQLPRGSATGTSLSRCP